MASANRTLGESPRVLITGSAVASRDRFPCQRLATAQTPRPAISSPTDSRNSSSRIWPNWKCSSCTTARTLRKLLTMSRRETESPLLSGLLSWTLNSPIQRPVSGRLWVLHVLFVRACKLTIKTGTRVN